MMKCMVFARKGLRYFYVCSGYHQITLFPLSFIKTYFFAPKVRKYVRVVMNFCLGNFLVVFIEMIHDLCELQMLLCEIYVTEPKKINGSTVIMDDCFMFAFIEDNIFIITNYICIVSRKYNFTWKIKKCQWFLQKVIVFFSICIYKGYFTCRRKLWEP